MSPDPEVLPEITGAVMAIGQEALDLAPEEYDLLVVSADFSAEGVAKLDSEARVGTDVLPLDVGFDALDRFEEMRAELDAAGQPLWTTATVTVGPDGTPRASFTYAG